MWTLMAVLVRIATAMNLQRAVSKYCTYYTPFQIELRRRMWWRIRYLDVFSSIDRGSELLISSDSYTVPLPTLTNDDLFDEHSTDIPVLEGCDTDMSFVNMCFDACKAIETLLMPELHPGGEVWEKRHKLALDFGTRADAQYMQYFSAGTPFDAFRRAVGESMKASMVLRAIRPMQRHVSTPPRVDSPYVLRMAMENLRSSEMIYNTKEADRWKWQIWVQWHALAVALAGLSSIRGTPLAEETWYLVERQYERSANYVADSKNGMLWKPVEKLYKKAAAFRDAAPKPLPAAQPETQQAPTLDTTTAPPAFDDPLAVPNILAPTTDTFQPTSTTFAPTFPNYNFGLPAAASLPMEDMSLGNGTLNTTQDFSAGLGNLDNLATDPTWVDWEQIMNDYADTGDMMAGVQGQTFPFGAQNAQNGNFTSW